MFAKDIIYCFLEIGRGRFGLKAESILSTIYLRDSSNPEQPSILFSLHLFEGGGGTGKALIGNNKIIMSYPVYPEPEYKLPEDMDLTDIVDLSQIPEELLSLTK